MFGMIVMLTAVIAPSPPSNGLEDAIALAQARTVKLYGLGAGPETGYGSGLVVSPDGQVLTTLSLLIDATNIRAVTPDGTLYFADVIARDPRRQMALLQLRPHDDPDAPIADLPAFVTGSSASLQPGDWLLAAGNPFKVAEGAEPVSVSLGVFGGFTRLDARRRRQDYPFRGRVLVLDAVTANPGAAGGPVVDVTGQWVGMVGRVVVSNLTHTQFNHAFPVETCLEFLQQARDPDSTGMTPALDDPTAAITPTSLGIDLFEMGYKKKLVFIERIKPGSPAQQAGLKPDDLVVSAMGKNVADLAGFRRILGDLHGPDALQLVVIRNQKPVALSIPLEPPS
ncbi:MAG: S1C family serine protease [Phycisphaerae bacterium]